MIIKNGAVSKEVVEAMASSVREISNTDIGVGISGIAGPGGGTVEKPVGTVYMAIDTKTGGVSSQRFSFDGTRKEIKMLSAKYALDLIRKSMINIYNGGKNGKNYGSK